jgi:hypothetical protein
VEERAQIKPTINSTYQNEELAEKRREIIKKHSKITPRNEKTLYIHTYIKSYSFTILRGVFVRK